MVGHQSYWLKTVIVPVNKKRYRFSVDGVQIRAGTVQVRVFVQFRDDGQVCAALTRTDFGGDDNVTAKVLITVIRIIVKHIHVPGRNIPF